MPPSAGSVAGRANVLGVGISAVDMARATSTVQGWIDRGQRAYVCVTGVHGVMESQQSATLKAIHNRAGLVLPDGMPMVWLLHWAGFRHADRVCGPEFMPQMVLQSAARGDRHFLYGSAPGTLTALQDRLLALAPGARIVGTLSPPFRALNADEEADVVARINAARPDIVWVGLSTPKQERWMAANRDRLDAAVLIGVGAAFDTTAGTVRRAPVFLRRTGLEWMFRLGCEPRRLWRRYLTRNPMFVLLVILQQLRLYRPPLTG